MTPYIKQDIETIANFLGLNICPVVPPEPLNLMTEKGAKQMKERLSELRLQKSKAAEIGWLEATLDAATVVQSAMEPTSIVFGALVHLMSDNGNRRLYRIVGVDEVEFGEHNVSWRSYIGKALLEAGGVGQRVSLAPDEQAVWTVVEVMP